MKPITRVHALLLSVVFLAASVATAAPESKNFRLESAAEIAGVQLQPGKYRVEWEGTGPTVEATILRGKEVVARTQATVEDLSKPVARDTTVITRHADGSTSLLGLRFAGKSYSLAFGDPATRTARAR